MYARTATIEVATLGNRRFAWAARVPWLPYNGGEDVASSMATLDRGYLNLATAVAMAAPEHTSVQLRLLSRRDTSAGQPGLVTACIVGSAASAPNCHKLWDLVSAALPLDLPLETATEAKAKDVMRWIGAQPPSTILEVRRRLESTDPGASFDQLVDDEPTIARWNAGPSALLAAAELLATQPGKAVLVLHMERAWPTNPLLIGLAQQFNELAAERTGIDGGEFGPLLQEMATDARERLRVLPRAALNVRVAVASDAPLRPGVAESIGMDLTRVGGFEIVFPTGPADRLDALLLFTEGLGRSWRRHPNELTEELRFLADPTEAASVVRFPQPPKGGMLGLYSGPVQSLPRSPQPPPLRPQNAGGSQKVTLGPCPYGGTVDLTLTELNQHTMVVGLPGFGKTSTLHTILTSLWERHRIPFLVLDPAKGDYGPLVDSLSTYSGIEPQRVVLGPDSIAFNPFVVPEGVSTAAHASRILGAIDAALQISSHWPMGYVTLSRGVFRAYEQCDAGESPTLRSVYAAVGDIIRTTPLDPKSRADVTGSLLGRLESMVRGPLGAAFVAGAKGGIDWEKLLASPTVIEFRGFAGPTERSLVFGLLIAGLASVREASFAAGHASGLKHVTVLEEAHRVLTDRSSTESEGVRLLAEAIAELRGSGEGFVIVDQAPTGLHPVIRKVCGSVIAHRLIEYEERSAIGMGMLLDGMQIDDLARLRVGRAVVFGSSRVSAAVVDVERPVEIAREVRQPVRSLAAQKSSDPLLCVGCTAMCRHREQGRSLANNHSASEMLTIDFLNRVPPDPAWCGVAHATAQEFDAQYPPALFRELQARRELMARLVATKTAADKAKAEPGKR